MGNIPIRQDGGAGAVEGWLTANCASRGDRRSICRTSNALASRLRLPLLNIHVSLDCRRYECIARFRRRPLATQDLLAGPLGGSQVSSSRSRPRGAQGNNCLCRVRDCLELAGSACLKRDRPAPPFRIHDAIPPMLFKRIGGIGVPTSAELNPSVATIIHANGSGETSGCKRRWEAGHVSRGHRRPTGMRLPRPEIRSDGEPLFSSRVRRRH
jgi:hypothetical protein